MFSMLAANRTALKRQKVRNFSVIKNDSQAFRHARVLQGRTRITAVGRLTRTFIAPQHSARERLLPADI